MESGEYSEMNSSYLVDPSKWTENSKLSEFEDIGYGPFPALYGGWLCTPPTMIMDAFYVDCMRFLPGEDYSKKEDFGFIDGPIKVMTY